MRADNVGDALGESVFIVPTVNNARLARLITLCGAVKRCCVMSGDTHAARYGRASKSRPVYSQHIQGSVHAGHTLGSPSWDSQLTGMLVGPILCSPFPLCGRELALFGWDTNSSPSSEDEAQSRTTGSSTTQDTTQ